MSLSILRIVSLLALSAVFWAPAAQARTATADIARIRTGIATMEQVHVRLDWPKQSDRGTLQLRVGKLDAPGLGYAFHDLTWQCPLQRDGDGGWRCEGELRGGDAPPMQLGIALGTAFTDVVLRQGGSRLEVHRQAATPDDTRIDLIDVPVVWSQALLSRAWADGRWKTGRLGGRLVVSVPANRPLRVSGPLTLAGAALETPDGSIAAEALGAALTLDYRNTSAEQRVDLRGALHGGELLFGSAYVALPPTPVTLQIEAVGDARGWQLPMLRWADGGTLAAQGNAALAPDGTLRALDVAVDSDDLSPVTTRYLSGFLGSFGLADLGLKGGLRSRVHLDETGLRVLDAHFDGVDVREPAGKFRFDGLDGDVRFRAAGTDAGAPVESMLRWRSSQLYGLDFGAAELPLRSVGGEIALRAPATIEAIGGTLRFDHFRLRPPQGAQGLQANFGLTLDAFDIGKLAQSMGGPAFRGTLSGRIPDARYVDDTLVFEGGLEMRAFDGSVKVSSLAMERPFGVAPTVSADVALDDLDLLSVTEVFDFGSISGRLDGSIRELRLVDWTATAFDAELYTQRRRGVKQRISQRAVQNISSVGDASFVTSLQGQLIGLFDDFGYRRLGISCRLHNQVCAMGGLESIGRDAAGSGSDAGGFTIVQGSGIPRLNVVGFNRQVDWPTLLERIQAVGSGDLKPVVE